MKFFRLARHRIQAALLVMPIMLTCCALTSCDKVSELINKFKNKETEETISREEVMKSDVAVAKYLDAMEKMPQILAKVSDEKTAFEAREKLDNLSREVSLIVVDLVQIDGKEVKKMLKAKTRAAPSKAKNTKKSPPPVDSQKQSAPEIEGAVYWYVLEENTREYKVRVDALVKRMQAQILRIATITKESAVAFDVVFDGILTLVSVESGGAIPSENPVDVVKPMPKDWLPPGVTRE